MPGIARKFTQRRARHGRESDFRRRSRYGRVVVIRFGGHGPALAALAAARARTSGRGCPGRGSALPGMPGSVARVRCRPRRCVCRRQALRGVGSPLRGRLFRPSAGPRANRRGKGNRTPDTGHWTDARDRRPGHTAGTDAGHRRRGKRTGTGGAPGRSTSPKRGEEREPIVRGSRKRELEAAGSRPRGARGSGARRGRRPEMTPALSRRLERRGRGSVRVTDG